MNAQATGTYGQPVRRSSTRLSLFRFFLYLLTLISAIVTLILAAVLIATQRRHCKLTVWESNRIFAD